MNAVTRRTIFAALPAAAAVPAASTVQAAPRVGPTVAELCRAFHRATEALPRLDAALRLTLEQAEQLQRSFHDTQDMTGRMLDRLETTPCQTIAEAEAKVAVGRLLVIEGCDPKRYDFLASAEAELTALQIRPPWT